MRQKITFICSGYGFGGARRGAVDSGNDSQTFFIRSAVRTVVTVVLFPFLVLQDEENVGFQYFGSLL